MLQLFVMTKQRRVAGLDGGPSVNRGFGLGEEGPPPLGVVAVSVGRYVLSLYARCRNSDSLAMVEGSTRKG